LDTESEGIIPESDLFDDVVVRAPRFDFEAFAERIDRLVMRAVYFLEAMGRFGVGTQRLNVVILLLGKFVAWNVELQRAAKRNIKKLHPFANGENRQAARERLIDRCKFPAVSRRIDILLEHAWIGNRLLQKFRRDVGTARQKQPIDVRD